MQDNKEIVKWLSHMNSESGCTTFATTTSEKQQPVDEKQQIMDKINPILDHLWNAIAETSAEDTALSKEVSELLNKLQISPQTLANNVKENLYKISVVLRSHGLPDLDETALIISMDGKKIKEKQQQRLNRDLQIKHKELLNRHCVLERKLNYLKENVGLIRNTIIENEVQYKNEYSNYKLMTGKLVEYNATAEHIEADIDTLNLKELEPEKILDKYETFMKRKGQLAEINRALIPYRNLPPNLLQAKALLESKELEYNEITKTFLNMS